MRLHNNNEEFPIIVDTDIIMTDENMSADIGTTLHDVINEHDSKIERLESNVKWMYRYGALGSGGTSGGSGGGSTSKMTVFIYKDGTQPVSPGTRLMYSGEGMYKFKVEIHGGGSDTFLVKYYYSNGKSLSRILSKDNEFTTEDTIKLEGNNELTFTIKNQSTGEFYMVNNSPNLTFPYVTSAYNISANYVLGNDISGKNYQKYTPSDNIIFMSDVVSSGLMIAVNYNIAVQLQDSSTIIEYNDWYDRDVVIDENGMTISWYDDSHVKHEETREFDIKIKSNSAGTLYLPLVARESDDIIEFLEDNENASYKQVTVSIKSQLSEETEISEFAHFTFFDNLIPNGLFLNIKTTAGKLYNNPVSASTAIEANQIMSGDIMFKVTPYNGSLDTTRLYELRTYVYDVVNEEETLVSTYGPTILIDQRETDTIISISETGIKKIIFELTLSGQSVSFTYYIKIRTFASSFNWYPNIIVQEDGYDVQKELEPYYSATYRRNETVKNISSDTLFISGGNNIQMTSNDPIRTINLYYDPEKYSNIQTKIYDLMMAIGIQYSSINNTNIPILSFNVSTSTETQKQIHTIFVYQNKLAVTTSVTNISSAETISLSSKNISIFIPLEDNYKPAMSEKYHLFTIYKRLENISSNNYYRSLSTYIDGDLEGLLGEFLSADVIYDSITLYPGNYSLNLIELSMFVHSQSTEMTWMNDIDIKRYFNSYTEKITYRDNIFTDNERYLFDVFSGFQIDKKNRIIVDENDPQNIALTSECPVMLLYFDDVGQISGFDAKNNDNFMEWFERSYEENESAASQIPVTIKYSNGDGTGLHQINLPDTDSVANFLVDIQGSSTKTYRCKNLELYAPKADEGYDYIYSPNINRNINDPEYKSSFLPEGSFTLKADVVDSSHTNNNAIGKFVNDNTKQFQRAVNNENQHGTKYTANIKNTLIGFPVLLFLHTSYQKYDELNKPIPGVYKDTYYFLGIYNFNLGRKSYYNLGYKDISNIEPLIDAAGAPESGFAIYKINSSNNVQMNNIVGGEIQGNNAYFDFSQYTDNVLLFDDKSGMWGDYIGNKPLNNIQSDLKGLCKDVAFAGGFVFTEVGKRMSESLSDAYGYSKLYSNITTEIGDGGVEKTVEWVPNYHYQASVKQQTGTTIEYEYTLMTDIDGHVLNGSLENLQKLLVSYEMEAGTTNIPKLDFVSTSEYFTTMMAMGLVDSPMKNLNVKSWNNGQTFYLAFYDMDTGLGKNNAGTYINYFAFSDFWRSRWSPLPKTNIGSLNQVDVIRDYSPETFADDETGSSFFDVPSSYLFAVAKYAKSIFSAFDPNNTNMYEEINYYDPSNIWGRWRHQTGCLRNANYFMNTYFNHHLAKVPAEAFNFNYRYKYLVKNNDNTGFDSVNFIKFHGRGLAYTEYWLDGRLHILDAYFNVSGVDDTINIDNNVQVKASYTNDEYKPSGNEDVYVLQDAFSGGSQPLQYTTASSGNLIIEAKSYAPLIIQYPLRKERYLFPSNGEKSQIGINFTGNVTCLFGGSKLWTSVSSISPFITQDNRFSMYSKYISTIIGETRTCRAWTFDTPALRTLRLTSPNYSGDIAFESSETEPKYQNIDEINISGTAINLSAQNIPLRTLRAVGMQQGAEIRVVGCDKLENVEISGTFNNLQISSWGEDISLPTSGGTLTCNTISITNNIERFPDAALHISNNSELTTINLSGFSHLYISNCPKLQTINFNDSSDVLVPPLKTLDIQMPAFNNDPDASLTIGNTTNVIDLTNFNNLSTLRVSNSTIKRLKLPTLNADPNDSSVRRKITLLSGAFMNCKNFENFENEAPNDLYITGEKTFFNCGVLAENGFAMIKNRSTSMSNIYIDPNCTTLKDTFNCTDKKGRITYEIASLFLQTRCTPDAVANVASIETMFKNNVIDYKYTNKYTEYLSQTCSLPLWQFTNCSIATDVFSNNNVDFFNRYMFEEAPTSDSRKLFGNIELIELNTMCNTFTYGTIDMLYPFINHTTGIDFRQQANITIYNPTSSNKWNTDDVIYVNSLFYSNSPSNPISPSNIVSLRNFTLSPTRTKIGGALVNLIFSFKGLFDNDKNNVEDYVWTAAYNNNLSLQNFMNAVYTVSNLDEACVNTLFCNIVPTYIVNSFLGFNSNSEITDILNIYTMFNWDLVSTKTTNLFSDEFVNGNVSFGGLTGKKTCTYQEFQEIWTKLLSSANLNAISMIFTDAIITRKDWNIKFILTDEDIINTSITTIPNLFRNIILNDENGIQQPIDITSNIFRNIKNIKYVPYIFSNTYMKHAIPFDVFGKRKKSTDIIPCYIKQDNNYVNGRIVTYDYDNVIINMNEAFYNITFPNKEDATFRNREYNIYERNYAYALSDPNTKYNEYYKLESGEYVRYDVEQPLEIQDIDKIWADHQDISLYKTNDIDEMLNGDVKINIYKSTYSYEIRDYANPTSAPYRNLTNFCPNGFVVSPDIFRCCDKNCNITSSISYNRSSNVDPVIMTGMMPPSIFKTEYLRTIKFNGVFTGLNVTPIETCYWDEDEIDVIDRMNYKHKCKRTNIYYQYILDEFTDNDILNDCFNFTLLLPSSETTEYITTDPNNENTRYESKRLSQHFFMFDDKSLSKNILKMANSLPTDYSKTILQDTDAEHMHQFYVADNGIYFNIMRSFKTIVHSEEDVEKLYMTGIDKTVFRYFTFDSIISSDIAKIYEGYVLSKNNMWSYRHISDGALMFNQVGGNNTGYTGLSANARIQAQYTNDGMFPRNGNNYNINKSSLALIDFTTMENLNEYWTNYTWVEPTIVYTS